MVKYQHKPTIIEASQWFKNGDHPLDYQGVDESHQRMGYEGAVVRYFRHPHVDGQHKCKHANCGLPMDDHGWIDTVEGGHLVCPSDWVITTPKGEHYPCKADIFEKAYTPWVTPDTSEFTLAPISEEDLTFSEALHALKLGRKIARKGWNGSGMYAFVVNASIQSPSQYPQVTGDTIAVRPYLMLFTAQKDLAHWSPSGSDILAEDWYLLSEVNS